MKIISKKIHLGGVLRLTASSLCRAIPGGACHE